MRNIYLVSALSFFLGLFFHFFISNFISRLKKKKNDELTEKYFNEINSIVVSGLSNFITRLNSLVIISCKMADFGVVNIRYNVESKDLSVMKDDKEILSSNSISLKQKLKLSTTIEDIHGQKIQDVVDVFGQLLSREGFEETMRDILDKLKDIKKEEEIESENKFEIDEILDKINRVGIDNLTKEEKDFLNKFNK